MYSQERQRKDENKDCSSINGYKENREDLQFVIIYMSRDFTKHPIINLPSEGFN